MIFMPLKFSWINSLISDKSMENRSEWPRNVKKMQYTNEVAIVIRILLKQILLESIFFSTIQQYELEQK